jgi:hypothetical protein
VNGAVDSGESHLSVSTGRIGFAIPTVRQRRIDLGIPAFGKRGRGESA